MSGERRRRAVVVGWVSLVLALVLGLALWWVSTPHGGSGTVRWPRITACRGVPPGSAAMLGLVLFVLLFASLVWFPRLIDTGDLLVVLVLAVSVLLLFDAVAALRYAKRLVEGMDCGG